MRHKPRVYISSTYLDLREHRAAVKGALEKAQYDVEGMEKYPAFEQRPLDKCRADVSRADVLVLIVAHRYGFRPKQDNPERRSITELEYEEASRSGKARLVFIVDPSHAWCPEFIDTGRNALDLKSFRARLEHSHGIAFFTEPDQLASHVLQGVRAWESVESPFDAQPTGWSWQRVWDFSGYVAEKRRGFVGREWLFDEVRNWVADRSAPQALLICADFGVGKTAFMAELVAGPARIPVVAYHFCHHDTAETLNPATFVASVASQLSKNLAAYKSAMDVDSEARAWIENAQRDPASAFERAVIAPLAALPAPDPPCVLLIDGLDEALEIETALPGGPSTNIVRLLANHVKRLPQSYRILVTTRRRQEVLQPMRASFQCRMLDGEDDRNLDDIKAYALDRCARRRLAEALARAAMSADEVATFLADAKQSGGKFLYIVRVLNDLESGALSPQHLRSLPPGMDGFYLDAFERRFPTVEAYESIRSLLSVLCVMREPSLRAELAEILNRPESEVRSALATIEDFLRVTDKRYAFDHLSLVQWLTEENEFGFARAGRFYVNLGDAETLMKNWARHRLAAARAHISAYLAHHVQAHLDLQDRRDLFPLLLRNFLWLRARIRYAGINVLLGDWMSIAPNALPNALEHALRQAAHVLSHDDDQWQGHDMLASQLLGRLLQRAEPEIRELCASANEYARHTSRVRPISASLQSTPALIRTIQTHAFLVSAVAALPDGRIAVSGESESHENAIQVWSPSSGELEAVLEGHRAPARVLVVLGDARLASGSFDCTVRVWNLVTGSCEAVLRGHKGNVAALMPLTDGRLASGAMDGTIKLWNIATRKCQLTLTGHGDAIEALAVLADGTLVSSSQDGRIVFWDIVDGTFKQGLGLSCWSRSLQALPQRRLAFEHDDVIEVWRALDGKSEIVLKGQASTMALLADGRLAAGEDHGNIAIWNITTGVRESTLRGHSSDVTSLTVLPDGKLASGSEDGTVRIWDPCKYAGALAYEQHHKMIRKLALLPEGRVASWACDGIRVWNVTTGVCEASLPGHQNEISSVIIMNDGRLACCGRKPQINVWDLARGTCERTIELRADEVLAVAELADGRFALGAADGSITIYEAATEESVVLDGKHAAAVAEIVALSSGQLVSSDEHGEVKIWNLAQRVCETTLEEEGADVTAFVALNDGQFASAMIEASEIKLWHPVTGECTATLELQHVSFSALTMLPDGRLVSGSFDHVIRFWTPDSQGHWAPTVEFVADMPIVALAVAPEPSILIAGDISGRLHFLEYGRAPRA